MGNQGVTNYIHLIGAGHLSYFLHKYRSLYLYNQQGWVALNQKLKNFYFHNTNHGGSQGAGEGKARHKHMKDLMRLVQRSTMWTFGYGDAFFMPDVESMEE